MSEPPQRKVNSLDLAVELRRLAAELATERRWAQRVKALQPVYESCRSAIDMMQSSKFWQLRQRWFSLKHRLRLSSVGAAPFIDPAPIEQVSVDDPYTRWREQNDFRPSDADWMRRASSLLVSRPCFSFIVPTYNTPEAYLRKMLDSVIAQVYPHWELCIVDDASTKPHVRAVLGEYAALDSRINLRFCEVNGHISAASNVAIEMATGDFIALLDHDDVITADALFHYALVINEDPSVDMIYSDEDKIDDNGNRFGAFFKPDWSPDRFLSIMYTSHLGVYRTEAVRRIGGFRLGLEGSQDYDLVLRLTETTDRVRHIPRVLYHWRVHPESTTSGMDVKPYARVAALRALSEALDRRGEPGTINWHEDMPGSYTVRYQIDVPKRVSVIIPTRDHAFDVNRCLESLFGLTDYPDFEVVLLDNGSRDFQTLHALDQWSRREPARFRVVRHDVPFNYSAINNFAVEQGSSGDFLLFLNNDTEVITADWMSAMVEQAQRSSIGAVGARLLYEDKRIQHAGVILGIGGIGGHAFRFFPADHLGYYNSLQTITNYSAVTAACMMMRRSVFDEVGRFDERLGVAYNDVDLCLRVREAGYRIVYVPHAVLYHYESQSRGYDISPEQVDRDSHEKAFMEERWRFSSIRDPYYNPNLTLLREDFSLCI
jgi:O-antigen biosynthesis protein